MRLNRSSVMFVYSTVTDDRKACIGLFAGAILKTDNIRFLMQCQEHCFTSLSGKEK